MKKLLVSLSFLCAIVTAQAQSESLSFDFGARGGLNLSTVTGDDIESPDNRTSFYAGLVAETPITERFSLQGEVFYSGQGYDITEEENELDAEYQLGYIQVPVLAKIYLIDGLNIHAGPQFGFKVYEEIDFEPLDNGGDVDTDAVQDFDFQLTSGLEYKFDGGFLLQARYTYGFSEVVENSSIHNSVFSAGVGYMF
tara:strand:- start:41 stop:628 length:588 start_codon:yes stop_codon:yes gene_type:complete